MNMNSKGNNSKIPLKASRVLTAEEIDKEIAKDIEEYRKSPRGKLSRLKVNLESIKKYDIPIFKNAKSHFVINMIADSTNEKLEELIKLAESLEKELDK